MNSKSKMKVLYAEGVIEMNTTFAKMMQNPLSDEYALLQKTRLDNPNFAVRRRQIKTNPKMEHYKGLTYEYMRNYIRSHESEQEVGAVLAELDEKILISKCHSNVRRYPVIKQWFLNKYPEIAEFGMVAVDGSDAEENNVVDLPQEAAA